MGEELRESEEREDEGGIEGLRVQEDYMRSAGSSRGGVEGGCEGMRE